MNISLLGRLRELAGIAPADPAAEQVTQQANGLIASIRTALPDLLAAAIIDIESGQALASYSAEPALKPEKAAAYNAQVIKLKRQALQALILPQESIEDVLITMREQLHVLRVSTDGKRLLYLIVSSHDTNLAIARSILRDHS